MSLFIYAGLKARFLNLKEDVPSDKFHLTVMFAPLKATPRFYLDVAGILTHETEVIDVVYWAHVDLTVALVNNTSSIQHRFDTYSNDLGFEYDYDFVPHVTLGSGNITKKYSYLKNTDIDLFDEYIKIIEK